MKKVKVSGLGYSKAELHTQLTLSQLQNNLAKISLHLTNIYKSQSHY